MRKNIMVPMFTFFAIGALLVGAALSTNGRTASPQAKLQNLVLTDKDKNECTPCSAETAQADEETGWEDDGVDYGKQAEHDEQREKAVLAAIKEGTKWLPPTSQTQREIFDYLARKIGQSPSMPVYPADKLLDWSDKRYESLPNNPKDRKPLYSLVYQDLLIAQKLVQDKNPQRRRQALRLTNDINLYAVYSKLADKWLYARIYEAYILPNLDVAHSESWEDLSWQMIVETAHGAFVQTGEADKQVAVLRLYLTVADPDNDNTLEWARGQMAIGLAAQKKYAEAIEQLKMIKSPGLGAMKSLIPK